MIRALFTDGMVFQCSVTLRLSGVLCTVHRQAHSTPGECEITCSTRAPQHICLCMVRHRFPIAYYTQTLRQQQWCFIPIPLPWVDTSCRACVRKMDSLRSLLGNSRAWIAQQHHQCTNAPTAACTTSVHWERFKCLCLCVFFNY